MKNFKYIALVLAGASMYGTMSSFVKLFYLRGYSIAEMSFLQALFAAIFLGFALIFSSDKRKLKLSRKELISLAATGATIGLTTFLYYQSVKYISASLAIVLLMQFTWISLLLEWLFFKKKPAGAEIITILFVLAGTVLAGNLLKAEKIDFSWIGIILVLISSFTYAVYIVANSRAGVNVNWLPKSTLLMVGSAITIFLINARQICVETHWSSELLLIALFLAVIGTTLPTAFFAAGIPKIGAGISAVLMTVELPVAVICSSLLLKEPISFLQIIGILIMLGSIAFMNYFKYMKNKRNHLT
ncbi:DMT family transporter [Apibacter sp. HY039]|uniref:EamA family transporter n=1 Tax=Apibacter sp. HY039 TaxID=2501476 RepID=UPI000FEBACD4|nr:DMT family transporter [Apibacter sp. HY039]